MTDTIRPLSLVRLVAKGIAVCVVGGTIIGSLSWVAVFSFGTQSTDAILLLPFLPLYALPITLPLGIAAGAVGGAAIWALSSSALPPVKAAKWVWLGVALGAALGFSIPVAVHFIRRFTDPDFFLFWTWTTGLTGGACGGLLAWLTGREMLGARGRPTSA